MAVELLNSGKTSTEVGLELGIGHDTAKRWKDQLEANSDEKSKSSMTEEQREIARLRKELKEAKLERDILKKAVGIFSKNDGKFFNS